MGSVSGYSRTTTHTLKSGSAQQRAAR